MKQIYKSILALVCAVLLLFCSFPVAFAFDDTNTFYVPFAKPHVDNNSGYVEVFWSDGSGNKYVDIVSWTYTPISNRSNQDFLPTTNQVLCSAVFSSSECNFSFASNQDSYGYFAKTFMNNKGSYDIHCAEMNPDTEPYIQVLTDYSGCTIRGFHFYGNVQTSSGGISNPQDFTVVYAEDAVISSNLGSILTTLNVLYYLTEDYDESMLEYIDSMITSLNNFKGSFDEFEEFYKSKMTILLSYCEDFFQYLKSLVEYTDDLETYADLILTSCLAIELWISDLYWVEFDSNIKLGDINSKLQMIIDILSQKTDTEFTTQDPTQFDDYYDVENSLLNNDNVNVDDVVKVEVNQNALTVIWDYVERALNSHGKVFGMVLTILALGIIALILGR